MFERNIIDLVGLFIENVQSLYLFFDDPPQRHSWAVQLSRPIPGLPRPMGVGERHLHFYQKAEENKASSQTEQDAN